MKLSKLPGFDPDDDDDVFNAMIAAHIEWLGPKAWQVNAGSKPGGEMRCDCHQLTLVQQLEHAPELAARLTREAGSEVPKPS